MNDAKKRIERLETRGSIMFSDVSYDTVSNVLTVSLVNHTIYEHRQLPPSMWERFKKAASYGSFYNTYIKNVYQYKRIR